MALLASFAIPLLALGAAGLAVAVPVLIHLLSKQRFQVVEWAAMRFLLSAQKQHRRRIDKWLLLSARTFALLLPLAGMCAVTPWAEDIWQAITPGATEMASNAPRTHRVLVLDASMSMAAKFEGGTRFDQAVKQIEETIQAGNPGDGFSLIVLAGGAQAVVPGPSTDAEKVLSELRTVRLTHGATELNAGLAMIADTLSKSPRTYPRRQVLLFTDLQKSAWAGLMPKPDGTIPDIWRGILPRAEFAIVDASGGDLENVALLDLALNDPVALVDTPAIVTAQVQNFSKTDRKNVRLELSLGRPSASGPDTIFLPIEQRALESLPAGQRTTATFVLEGTARFREPGLHLLQLKLVTGDDLPVDDVRTLAVEVREAVPVVIVNGKPSLDPLQRASEYLQEALEPGGKRIPGNPIRPKTLSLSEFNDPTLGDLTNVDCVYLCDVPTLTPGQVSRLTAHLKRGGGLIIGLGPNAAANADWYNRTLYNNGDGLLPGQIGAVKIPPEKDELGFRLLAEEDAFRRAPLGAFREDNVRAALTTVPFKKYLTLDAPADGRARRILSFIPAAQANPKEPKPGEKKGDKFDPAIVEWPRYRGRVIVYTSTLNSEWNDWPILPTFLPFAHELTRFAAITGDRRTLRVHDTLEEFLPPTNVGLSASVTGPEGIVGNMAVVAGEETGIVRFNDTSLSGLYRVNVGSRRDRLFAVNPPESLPGGGSESDLRKLDASDFQRLGNITITTDPTDVKLLAGSDSLVTLTPKPHGPLMARILLTLGLALMILELGLAWYFGPGRSGSYGTPDKARRGWAGIFISLPALFCLVVAVGILAIVAHAEITGQLLHFLPDAARAPFERFAGVPAAAPGEGTRWRLERLTVFLKNARQDQHTLLAIGGAMLVAIVLLYRREARATGSNRAVLLPFALRVSATALMLGVLMPQTRLAFDREGWPDVAILLDTSASMATVDQLQDPEVKAQATKLAALENLTEVDRLRLAKLLVLKVQSDVLRRLLEEKQVKVHIYTMADQAKLIQECIEPSDLEAGREAIQKLTADGESSRLGDAIQAVLKAFRGGSLEAIIGYTDGVVTGGDDLAKAGREAARAGVPLYLVGLGESREPPDVSLSDLKVDDVVLKNDTLLFEARLTSRGVGIGPTPVTVPVILYERQGDKLVERARSTATLDPSGKPVPIKLSTIPTEAGEKTFVIDVPVQTGEMETNNNRLERVVLVTENKRLKVLYIDGYPRYEFRFLKVLLERESDAVAGNKSIELSTLLLDAAPGYAEQDKSALRNLPTKTELFGYDVVLFGDVDPANLPRAAAFFADLSEFVQVKGGGLLFMAGGQSNPVKLYGTPLAELLPVLPADITGQPDPTMLLVDGYRPKLTAYGRAHPLLRLSSDDAENAKLWAAFKPLYWTSTGFRNKTTAEVLAVHPDRPADGFPGENHPLILQQFVGSGRVMFFAFDETWRWRFRASEEKYNQFWMQAIRTLSRSRVTRAEVRTDKQTSYRRDEPIRVTVRFPDDAPPPGVDAPIKVQVDRTPLKKGTSAAESQTVQLSKVEGTRATYQTMLTRTPEGEYKFTLIDPVVTGSKPRAEARVLPPAGERDRIDMNRAELTRAATESRGKFYTLLDAARVIDDLPEVARVPLNQPVPPIPIWNHAAMFALVVALLGLEWILRRRERLL
jgi:von Willebrand factor type A domain/Aerotolerance regulator N-terminal